MKKNKNNIISETYKNVKKTVPQDIQEQVKKDIENGVNSPLVDVSKKINNGKD